MWLRKNNFFVQNKTNNNNNNNHILIEMFTITERLAVLLYKKVELRLGES